MHFPFFKQWKKMAALEMQLGLKRLWFKITMKIIHCGLQAFS